MMARRCPQSTRPPRSRPLPEVQFPAHLRSIARLDFGTGLDEGADDGPAPQGWQALCQPGFRSRCGWQRTGRHPFAGYQCALSDLYRLERAPSRYRRARADPGHCSALPFPSQRHGPSARPQATRVPPSRSAMLPRRTTYTRCNRPPRRWCSRDTCWPRICLRSQSKPPNATTCSTVNTGVLWFRSSKMRGCLKPICRQPSHPYTTALVAAAARSGMQRPMHRDIRPRSVFPARVGTGSAVQSYPA